MRTFSARSWSFHLETASLKLRTDDRKRSISVLSACRVNHRGILAGGGTDLLADSGAKDRLRPRRPTVGLHGHAHLAGDSHASGSRGRASCLRGSPAHDAHGAANTI